MGGNEDFESEHSRPVCLEVYAAALYTTKIFFKVRNKIQEEALFFVVDKIEIESHQKGR